MCYGAVGISDLYALCKMGELAMDIAETKAKVERWLMEEGFKVTDDPHPKCVFRLSADNGEGRSVSILQRSGKVDQVEVGVNVEFESTETARISKMEPPERMELLWNLRFQLINLGVGFRGLDLPLRMITVETVVYYDGFTKHEFIHRVALVRRAMVAAVWTVNRYLKEPPRSLGFQLPQ